MDIFLLRHAETESNKQGALSSSIDDVLTKLGLEQANSIVAQLGILEINSILSSPYPRAINTITPFAKTSGLKINTHACLAEGQLVLDSNLESVNPEYEIGNGYPIQDESQEQFIGRAKEASKLLLKQQNSRTLVVSHGHMIREILNTFMPTPSKIRYPHDNCGLTHISFGESVIIKYINRAISSNKIKNHSLQLGRTKVRPF